MTDIWDEKPDTSDEKYQVDVDYYENYNQHLFWIDMNAWLEKLKERLDYLIKDCEGFQKLTSESTLRGESNRKKLEAIKGWYLTYKVTPAGYPLGSSAWGKLQCLLGIDSEF